MPFIVNTAIDHNNHLWAAAHNHNSVKESHVLLIFVFSIFISIFKTHNLFLFSFFSLLKLFSLLLKIRESLLKMSFE